MKTRSSQPTREIGNDSKIDEHAPVNNKGVIKIDTGSLNLPRGFIEEQQTARSWLPNGIALVILVISVLFILFVTYLISISPAA